MENQDKKQSIAKRVKVVFGLDINPNERESKILSIVEKAVVEQGTISTYTKLNDVAYLRNKERKYIIKIDKESFTLVLEEANKVLLNVHLPAVMANKLFAVIDRKIDQDVLEIESDIHQEGEKVLDNFNSFLTVEKAD